MAKIIFSFLFLLTRLSKKRQYATARQRKIEKGEAPVLNEKHHCQRQGRRGCEIEKRSLNEPFSREADERKRIGPEGSIWRSRSQQIVFFLTVGLMTSLCSEIIEIDQMEEILPYLDESTWVLLKTNSAAFGLAPFQEPVNAKILKELAYIGIEYTFNAPFYPYTEAKFPKDWEGGLLFISDFNQKAEVFRKWIEMAKFRPSKIVIIDDCDASLIEMEKEMAEIKIPCSCFRLFKKG